MPSGVKRSLRWRSGRLLAVLGAGEVAVSVAIETAEDCRACVGAGRSADLDLGLGGDDGLLFVSGKGGGRGAKEEDG